MTPTSYLELIMTFKKLLDIKRQEIMTLKQRYVTGLEKLDFASSQVSVMQQELSDLQPELIKTSAETEKLMVKIEQDTVEVEAKKEVRVRLLEDQFVSLHFNAFANGRYCDRLDILQELSVFRLLFQAPGKQEPKNLDSLARYRLKKSTYFLSDLFLN